MKRVVQNVCSQHVHAAARSSWYRNGISIIPLGTCCLDAASTRAIAADDPDDWVQEEKD